MDLDLALLWRPEGAFLDTEVLGTVEDDCVLRAEGYWGHVAGE